MIRPSRAPATRRWLLAATTATSVAALTWMAGTGPASSTSASAAW